MSYFDATKVGGLIHTANNSFLTDNEVGIYFHKFNNKQNMSRITETTFNTVDGFEGTFNLYNDNNNNPIGATVGIVCVANNLRRPIVHNTFMGNGNATIAQQKGVGIHNTKSYMNVGNGTVEGQNTFVNNYKGVDYYSPPSLLTQFKVKTNIFSNNVRSITLTGGALAEITQNQIYEVPTDNYGIFLDATKGFILDHNIVQSNQVNSMGLVIKNTGDYASEITENLFGGAFLYGNIFIDKNEKVKIDCNTYHTQKDWVIFPTNLVDAFLEPQGECDPDESQKARRNMFHNPQMITNPNARHIVNLSTTNEVFYRSYPEQELIPTLVTGNADIEACNEVSGPSQCSQFFGLDYCNPDDIWAALVGNSTMGDKERLLEYTKLLYARLCQDQYEQAKTDLHTEARDASYKVLTATYTDENDTLKALEALSKLPLNDPDNADFYNLFMQLLNSPIGSGKNSSASVALHKVAQQNDHSAQALAQSMVASNSLSVFDKVVPMFSIDDNMAITTADYFKLYPNPAANTVQVQLQQMPTNAYIQLYNIQGSLLYSTPIAQQTIDINTNSYPAGIYYCKLIDSGNTIATQKLIIIR